MHIHARKGKRGKKNSPRSGVTCMYLYLYGSVDAALGKLESKKPEPYLPDLTSYCCWAIAKVQLGVRTCMKKAGYNPSLTCINIRAKHVIRGM